MAGSAHHLMRLNAGSMSNTILVMLGGATGAAMRYHFARFVAGWLGAGWPTATLSINIGGGLAMGILAGCLAKSGDGETWRLLLGVGLLGGFTTFSAFSLEMMQMINADRWAAAMSYAAISVAGSLVAVAAGMAVVRLV